MTDQQIELRRAAAGYVEAKRLLEERDHTGPELEKLIARYRDALAKLLSAAIPVGLAELAAPNQEPTERKDHAA